MGSNAAIAIISGDVETEPIVLINVPTNCRTSSIALSGMLKSDCQTQIKITNHRTNDALTTAPCVLAD